MTKTLWNHLLLCWLFLFCSFFCVKIVSAVEESPVKAKNVILMIGDGMGFNQHIAGSYWRHGELGKNVYEKFPLHCACTTFSARTKESVPEHYPGYNSAEFWAGLSYSGQTELANTTDSSAASTAIHGGTKTRNGYVGVDVRQNPIKSIAEFAHEAGKSVGTVTTVVASHATPAGVFAYNTSRDNYSDIFNEQIGQKSVDVVMGAGHPMYDSKGNSADEQKRDYQFVGGEETWRKITSAEGYNGYTFIDTLKDFEALAQKQGSIPKKVIGIPRIQSVIPPVDGNPDSPADPKAAEKLIHRAFNGFQTEEIPTLSAMSLAALNVLSQNEQGFFVMIEGGAIDSFCHANNQERVVLEQAGFAKAIETVVDWVEKNSSWEETVLIVTADHETGRLWGTGTFTDQDGDEKFDAEKDQFNDFLPIANNGSGKLPGMAFLSGGHTNALVPVWGIGVGINEIPSYYDGTDEKAARFWNFSGNYIDNIDIAWFLRSKM